MEKRNICLSMTKIRSHVSFANNLREAQAKQGKILVALKWNRSTCYLKLAILIGDPVGVTTLLLLYFPLDRPKMTNALMVVLYNIRKVKRLYESE